MGMIGEELNACAFKHYMDAKGHSARILLDEKGKPIRTTQGTQRGKRLDRWIVVNREGKQVLYQCEIKNSSSTAIGGRCLKVEADEDEIRRTAHYNWSRDARTAFSDRVFPNNLTKVFVKMKLPKGYKRALPLLIYWQPISNSNNLKPFFAIPISRFKNTAIKTGFRKLYIFSVSLYFRQLLKNNKKVVSFDMPISEYRIKILKSLGIS